MQIFGKKCCQTSSRIQLRLAGGKHNYAITGMLETYAPPEKSTAVSAVKTKLFNIFRTPAAILLVSYVGEKPS